MIRVLLTGARAPVTLDLARRFSAAGHEVYLADSLRFGCAALSRSAKRFFRVPRPRTSPREFAEALKRIVAAEQIDFLIPTCEEAFYVSAFRDSFGCEVLVDSLDKLRAMHNKWTFAQTAVNEQESRQKKAARVPETIELTSRDQLHPFVDRSTEFVFKPVYSRFASETLIGPASSQLKRIDASPEKPWIAQRKISGVEHSTYSVARAGKLVAHSCYISSYRAGRGSGIYFRSVFDKSIRNFVSSFVARHNFTGQIGFDTIVDEHNVPWIIECNPRATSGLHLFADEAPLVEAILGNCEKMVEADSPVPKMFFPAMPVFGLRTALHNMAPVTYIRDMYCGRDVLFRWTDPFPSLGLPATIAELAWIAIRERKTLQQAATHDIEWNGESI